MLLLLGTRPHHHLPRLAYLFVISVSHPSFKLSWQFSLMVALWSKSDWELVQITRQQKSRLPRWVYCCEVCSFSLCSSSCCQSSVIPLNLWIAISSDPVIHGLWGWVHSRNRAGTGIEFWHPPHNPWIVVSENTMIQSGRSHQTMQGMETSIPCIASITQP